MRYYLFFKVATSKPENFVAKPSHRNFSSGKAKPDKYLWLADVWLRGLWVQ
jgi:hypothetical protein